MCGCAGLKEQWIALSSSLPDPIALSEVVNIAARIVVQEEATAAFGHASAAFGEQGTTRHGQDTDTALRSGHCIATFYNMLLLTVNPDTACISGNQLR